VVGVNVTAGVVAVVDIGRGVVVEEGLRSQGFGGDACMSEWKEENFGWSRFNRIRSQCQWIHVSAYGTPILGKNKLQLNARINLVEHFFGINPPHTASGGRIVRSDGR